MNRMKKWCMIVAVGLSGGAVPSCNSTWFVPTREAAVDGVADFVSQTVFTLLDGIVDLGDPGT